MSFGCTIERRSERENNVLKKAVDHAIQGRKIAGKGVKKRTGRTMR